MQRIYLPEFLHPHTSTRRHRKSCGDILGYAAAAWIHLSCRILMRSHADIGALASLQQKKAKHKPSPTPTGDSSEAKPEKKKAKSKPKASSAEPADGEGGKGKGKKPRKKKDKNEPKRGLSAFMFFSQANREKVCYASCWQLITSTVNCEPFTLASARHPLRWQPNDTLFALVLTLALHVAKAAEHVFHNSNAACASRAIDCIMYSLGSAPDLPSCSSIDSVAQQSKTYTIVIILLIMIINNNDGNNSNDDITNNSHNDSNNNNKNKTFQQQC